jgi:hypothetical protein
LLGLLFGPEDGDSIFFRNVGKLVPDYTVSYPKGLYPLAVQLSEFEASASLPRQDGLFRLFNDAFLP